MNRITDEILEKRLSEYYSSDIGITFTFHPAEKRGSAPFSFLQNRAVIVFASLVLAAALGISAFFLFRPDRLLVISSVVPTEGSCGSYHLPQSTDPSKAPTAAVPTSEAGTVGTAASSIQTQAKDKAESRPPKQDPSVDREPYEGDVSAPALEPTEPKKPTETAEPIVPASDIPEEGAGGSVYCDAQFDVERLQGCDTVYCRLRDENGQLIGDADLYSDEHIAYVSFLPDRTVFVSYNLLDLRDRGVDVQKGRYHFWFYTVKGDAYEGIISFDPDG